MVTRVLISDDNNQLAYLAMLHPLIKLTHDLLDVSLDLVIR
jgi:hypothetical protein